MSKKLCLVILDGWGKGKSDHTDAVFKASTPFVDSLYNSHSNAQLLTDGLNVGLPEGQMGNSEVGHMNIGAGRVVDQDLVRINKSIDTGTFFENEVLHEAMLRVKDSDKSLHLMGLVGHGGVHASQNHLIALCQMAESLGIENVFIHAFMDGRDTDPKSGVDFLRDLESKIKNTPARIASVVGRYYAMDRDKRWERIKLAYDLLLDGKGKKHNSAIEAVEDSYSNNETDEFILPRVIVNDSGEPLTTIKEGDSVVCFNFRTDRCRQITDVLTQEDKPEHQMTVVDLHYVTMTNYDDSFKGIHVVFDKEDIRNTLGEFLSNNQKTQLRIAETEKYPHVSFFFSGGREELFQGELRKMIPSPKVATYDLQPEMSAPEVRDSVIEIMNSDHPDFICLNFANPDMVGHTGVFEAIKKACETVDSCLKEVVEAGLKRDYSFIIIADHGNADNAVNPDGSPNTAHSLNPVPIIVIDEDVKRIKNGILADVAPTVLDIMGLTKPAEMTGVSLIED